MGLAFCCREFYCGHYGKSKNTTRYCCGEHLVVTNLDLIGLKCPLPVLKARRQLGQMAAGAVLVVLADDPAAPLDFDHFCQTSGHQLLESTESNGIYMLRIAKSAD